MKLYTRRGDGGDTSLFGGRRVRKSAPRVEAYGTVDELNSHLGVARAYLEDRSLADIIARLQADLFRLGADLATPLDGPGRTRPVPRIGDDDVKRLERLIDELDGQLPPLKRFVLPGGHPAAAHLHLARAVCRSAERRTFAALEAGEAISPAVGAYLNRLSDLLFVLARCANHRAGIPDVPWNPEEG